MIYNSSIRSSAIAFAGFALLMGVATAQSSTVEGFDGGSDGGFTGNANYVAAGGNPDGNAYHLVQAFFPELRTGAVGETVNPNLVGDYSGFDEVTFSVDVQVHSITGFAGNQIARPYGIKLIDRDISGPSGSSGVYFELAVLFQSAQPNWTTLSVTIDDPTATALPSGWVGFGDEDPSTFEPILPPGATFASVLAGVDEVHLTGAAPGFFFAFANFDVRIDNVTLDLSGGSLGTELCTGVPNSTGAGANLDLLGSDVVAANDLTIAVSDLPMNSLGYTIHSQGTLLVMNAGGSQGNLCISGAVIGRFVGNVLNSGTAGAVSFMPDLTALPWPGGSVPALVGETRYFQYWYRDVVGGVNVSNFSSAECLLFQ